MRNTIDTVMLFAGCASPCDQDAPFMKVVL
jgi:hypothetical protein